MKKTTFFVLVTMFFSITGVALAQTSPDSSNTATPPPPSSITPPPPNTAMPPPNTGGPGMPGSGGPGLPGSGGQNMPSGPFQFMNPTPGQGGPSGGLRMPQNNMGGQGGQGMQNQNQGGQFQGNQGGNDEERMKKDQQRMLQDMQKSTKQMERDIGNFEKRFKTLAGKGVPIDQDSQDALVKAKALIEQIKNAKTVDEASALPMDDFRDYMQTLNEGMQKAEMGAQFPKMLKEANKIIKQQQTAYARAQTKSSKLKIDVSSLLSDWKKLIDDMVSSATSANQDFKDAKIDDAVQTLRDKVFDAMNDVTDKQKLFDMVSNFQQMSKNSDREIKTMQKDLAKLKKQGKDTGELEALLNDGQAKMDEIKKMISGPNLDADVLIAALEDAQTVKGDFYDKYSEITGQPVPGSSQGMQIPGLQYNQLQMPQSFGNFMNTMQPQQGSFGGKPSGPSGADGGQSKPTCRIDSLGIEVPGKCPDVEKLFNTGGNTATPPAQNVPTAPQVPQIPQAPMVPQVQQQPPAPANTISGPQSLKKTLEELSGDMRATVVDSLKRYIIKNVKR